MFVLTPFIHIQDIDILIYIPELSQLTAASTSRPFSSL